MDRYFDRAFKSSLKTDAHRMITDFTIFKESIQQRCPVLGSNARKGESILLNAKSVPTIFLHFRPSVGIFFGELGID